MAASHSITHPGRRGSVLIIVLVTLVFAVTAMTLFLERANSDLLVEVREADRLRLRQEAYSALETTLAVLVDFREVLGGLHSPAEGWGQPLEWIGYEPAPGHEVTVEFVDESGRMSLPRADFRTLTDLFMSWGIADDEAERLSDALMGWMQEDYEPSSFDAPDHDDYELTPLPFHAPKRPLRTWSELRSIDVVREEFFDEDGIPNDLGRRFMSVMSLFDFSAPNLNSAPVSVLQAMARYDEQQIARLEGFRRGNGEFGANGPGYFTNANEVANVLGEQAVTPGFGASISALRINVTVVRGRSSYGLSAVVAPPGGARAVMVDPLPRKDTDEMDTPDNASADTTPPAAADPDEEPQDLEYPFTLLEIREIDSLSAALAAEAANDF